MRRTGVAQDGSDTPDGYQHPTLEHHGESTNLTLKTVRHDETGTQLEIGAVDIFVGACYAIAIQSSPDALEGASEHLSTRPEVATHEPVAAAWAVFDAVIDGTKRVATGLGDQLERIHVAVFQSDRHRSEPIYLQLREAVIAAAAAMITGIFGMNFRHMPELGWIFGYPLAIAIMVLTVVVLHWYPKRAGWL